MGAVADLHNACPRRGPAGLWISPEEFKVDYRLGWGAFDKLLEDASPFFGTWHFFQALEYFVNFYGVVPRFRLAARCLPFVPSMNNSMFCFWGTYVVVHNPNHHVWTCQGESVG